MNFFKKKNTNGSKVVSGYEFSLDDSDLDQLKIDLKNQFDMISELRSDFLKLLLVGNIDMFTSGDITIVDKQFSGALLPEYKTSYVNIMGVLRFMRLKDTYKEIQPLDKTVIDFFSDLIQEDGDVTEDILTILQVVPGIKETSDIFKFGTAGDRLALRINNSIVNEDMDMKLKMKKMEDNKYVIERINAIFEVVKSISSVEMRKK